MDYFALKFLHVVGASVLLGTGAGIAFFMLLAHRTGQPAVIAGVARIVVIADLVFTATAVVAQPVTGVLLARNVGYSLFEAWILWSIILYLVTGAFWLPVDLDAAAAARSRDRCGAPERRAAARLSRAVPLVVRLRLSGFRCRDCDLLADDRATPGLRRPAWNFGRPHALGG